MVCRCGRLWFWKFVLCLVLGLVCCLVVLSNWWVVFSRVGDMNGINCLVWVICWFLVSRFLVVVRLVL